MIALTKIEEYLATYALVLPGDDDYYRLLDEKDWSAAQVILEKRITADPQFVPTRLCWILCQLELRTIPVTALSASLDELISAVQEDQKLHSLGFALYLKAAIELVRREQYKLAAIILEHLRGLSEVVIAGPFQEELTAFIQQVIKEEIVRAQNRREDKSYIHLLEERLKVLEKSAGRKDAKRNKRNVESGSKQPSSARAILQHQLAREQEVASAPNELRDEEKKREPWSARAVWLGVIVALLLCLAAAEKVLLPLIGGELREEQLAVRLALEPRLEETGVFYLPMPSEMGHQQQINKVASMAFSRLQERIGKVAEGGIVVASSSVSSAAAVSSSIAEASGAAASSASSAAGAEQAEQEERRRQQLTSGVNDSSKRALLLDIQEDIKRQTQNSPRIGFEPEDDKRNQQELPRLDVEKIKETKVESLDSKDGLPVKVTTDGLIQGGDGRVYAKEPHSSDQPESSGTDRLSYPVEEFGQPRKYKMIAASNVLSAPSSVSYVVGKLGRGDHVYVGAKMGPWLEIISERGRKGYVYAQDAKYVGVVSGKDLSPADRN